MFNLPSDFISGALGYTQNFWSDISPIVLILLGLGIGFIIIEKIISLFTSRKSEEYEDDEEYEEDEGIGSELFQKGFWEKKIEEELDKWELKGEERERMKKRMRRDIFRDVFGRY